MKDCLISQGTIRFLLTTLLQSLTQIAWCKDPN